MPNYEVHYLSVSDADAIIIRYENSGDQYVVLIDAGNVSDSDKIKNYIWNHWKTYTIDLAICTHPDSDHKGGFFGLLNDRDVIINEFWLNTPEDVIKEDEYNRLYPKRNRLSHCRECYDHPTDTDSLNLIDLAVSNKCNVYGAYCGKIHSHIPISVVGPSLDFYHPLAIEILKNNKRRKDEDNTIYNDIEVPHHGSKHNLTSVLIDKLAPCCAIISAKGSRKHPSRGIVHCLSNHCNVYSTHKSGTLIHTSYPITTPAIPLKEKQ